MDKNDYVEMQKTFYKPLASQWRPELPHRNHVVGWFEEHSAWPGYEHLFANVDTKDMVALDFGCGPGRGIVKYWNRFKRVDGVDLMDENLRSARWWIQYNNLDDGSVNLYKCNGTDLSAIPSEQYDFIYSMICMQHICVYDIRLNYLKEFYRVLKPGGIYSFEEALIPRTNILFNRYFGHVSISAGELTQELSSVGFEIEHFERGRLFPRCFVRARKTIDR